MQQPDVPFQHDLILLGGGHSHALVLLRWAMQPLPGVRLTLVSELGESPYSGMLPGLVAGHYERDDVHIDLRRLCQHVGARFIQARVAGMDPHKRTVQLQDRPDLQYDTLSINVGATPDLSVPGAAEFSTPVKPIAHFWPRWLQVRDRLLASDQPQTIALVGGGAGSVELALSMAHRLQKAKARHRVMLVTRGAGLLPGYPQPMLRWLQQRLQRYDIQVTTHFDVARVEAGGLISSAGDSLPADEIFWCTQARAAVWPGASGLAVTDAGFVRVLPSLQTVDFPDIFAAGDCAWMDASPSARAGVYAVRQAPVLFQNLRRFIQGEPLRDYRPQHHFLSLLATGDKDAVGARGRLAIAGPWVWRWKDRIDRRFMNMLQQLPVQPPPRQDDNVTLEPPEMRCGGCGGKVGADVLRQALAGVQQTCTLDASDDAAVIPLSEDPNQPALVQSVDALKPLFDDPWLFARITTQHALSDLYAMHAEPHSAQLQVQLPVAKEALQVRDLQQILQGVQQELAVAGATLLGGHTLEGDPLQLGLTVNGFATPAQLRKKIGARSGDGLILTKPLGVGAIFSAAMRGAARSDWVEQSIASMLQSNKMAADICARFSLHGLTDITGFGLLGHLLEMLGRDAPGAQLHLNSINVLPGAIDCINAGYRSTLSPANQRARHRVRLDGVKADDPRYQLLFDPQTSGGLLAAVAAEEADACWQALRQADIPAVLIGHCTDQDGVIVVP